MSSLRKRTHSSPITTNTTPRKKTKESSTATTPKKVITPIKSNYSLRTSVRPKDKQQDRFSIGKGTPNKSKKNVNDISTNSLFKVNNDGEEVSGELTRSTSSLSIEENNNIGSNASSPLSSPPPSSPNLENDAENDNDSNDDTIEPLLLPNVVWVKDEKRGWWPSEIISKDKSEKPLLIRLFGQKQPCTLELHNISKSNILPFHDESFVQLRKTGENSNMKELFSKAIVEAMVKETEENDGLPSKDFAFQMVVDSSPNNRKKKNGRKSLTSTKGMNHSSPLGKEISNKEKFTGNQEISNLSDTDFGKDETLQIPGECVLAFARKKYYPAKIIEYNEPDKYKVLFCDNSNGTVKRKDFFTKFEDGFKTCELGVFDMHPEDPNYEEPKLVKKIQSLEPILSRILRGKDSSWRFEHFYKGGKKLKLLASKVSPGPFSLDQFVLIAKVLRGIFIPEIADSIDRKNKIFLPAKLAGDVKNSVSNVEDHEEKLTEDNKSVNIDESITIQQQKKSSFDFEFLSSDLKLRFVNDVLIPETIIRLVMNDEKIGYEEADIKISNGYYETRWGWVEHLMAERASFQVGSESLRERLK